MEQLSLFDMNLGQEILATCIWKYEEEGKKTEPIDDWMRKLVPDGEYAVMIGEHPMVLRRTTMKPDEVPKGLEFMHYMVGDAVYSGIFVGRVSGEEEIGGQNGEEI